MLVLIFSVLYREILEVKDLWFLVYSGYHNKMLLCGRGRYICHMSKMFLFYGFRDWEVQVKVLADLFGV